METATGNEYKGRRNGSPKSLRQSILDEDKEFVDSQNIKPYRILIADDHALTRRGIRTLLETHPGLEVCCEVATGVEALEQVRNGKPDLAILDLTMPQMNGLEVLRTIRQESMPTEVLILTMHFADDLAREVLRTGALGYILKSDVESELIAAVDRMRLRQPYYSIRLSASMAKSYIAPPPSTRTVD